MPKRTYLEVGQVVGTHGVRGELRVQPWCDSADQMKSLRTLYWNEGETAVGAVCRPHGTVALVKLDGVDTVEQAQALRGRVLFVHRDDLKLPPGRYFIDDLLGLRVTDANTGEDYGELCEVSHTGANDVYHLRRPSGEEVLIPVIEDVFRQVDIDGGVVRITPLKGLFDDAN